MPVLDGLVSGTVWERRGKGRRGRHGGRDSTYAMATHFSMSGPSLEVSSQHLVLTEA